MRKGILATWLCLLFMGICVLFWRNEWIYNLPTPVPENYRAVQTGTTIDTDATGAWGTVHNKPLFLHFFNPQCPCSKFNMPHFKSLVKQYGQEVNFAIVVMSNKSYTAREMQERFDLDIPVLFDSAIAAACGVYATPQAVILDKNDQLYYRGNYNKSRYCTDTKSNYAQIALESLLHKTPAARFDAAALQAYGCQLPTCNKE